MTDTNDEHKEMTNDDFGTAGLKSGIKSINLYEKALNEISSCIPKNAFTSALNAVNNGTLRIAFVGDSITEGTDQLDPDDFYTERVIKALKYSLPDVNIISRNYAMLCRTADNFVDKNYKAIFPEPDDFSKGYWRYWSKADESWIDAVKGFNPDLLIIAFGMNDAAGEDSDYKEYKNIEYIIDSSAKWASHPSVVIVTSQLPTKNPSHTMQSQNCTLSVIRADRILAITRGIYCADAGRLFHILRDGLDDVSRAANVEFNWNNAGNDWMEEDGGNNFTFKSDGISTNELNKYLVRNRKIYNGSIEFDVKFKSSYDSDTAWIEFRRDEMLGSLVVLITPGSHGQVNLYKKSHDNKLAVISSAKGLNLDIAISHHIKITFDDNHYKVYVDNNSAAMLDAISYSKMHDGIIRIGGPGKVPDYSNLIIKYKDELKGGPCYSEDELIGLYKQPYTYGIRNSSGNGINHPTGMGHDMVYFAAFLGMINRLSQ